MADYPNIFKYATKELAQDAMICWFLECLKIKDENIHNIGNEFLRAFVFKDSVNFTEAELIDCHKQLEKMDVYARVLVDKQDVYPIIFENKTNTFLHSDQLERYCDKVYYWFWKNTKKALKNQKKDISDNVNIDNSKIDFSKVRVCNIQYVLFKSSYIFDWEEKDFETRRDEYCKDENKKDKVKFHLRRLEDMHDFLRKLSKVESCILSDYSNYIAQKVKEQNETTENWKSKKSLNCYIGQMKFWDEALKNDKNIHMGHSGKTEYTSYGINDYSVDNYSLNFRFEPRRRKIKNTLDYTHNPYLQLQLYRECEKNDSWIYENLEIAKEICNKIIGEGNECIYENDSLYIEFKSEAELNNLKCDWKGAEIFRITFEKNGKNKTEDVINFIIAFTKYYREKKQIK